MQTSKLFLLVIGLLFSTLNFAERSIVKSYDNLAQVLAGGDHVRAIIFVNQCQPENNANNNDETLASMDFSVFNKYTTVIDGKPVPVIASSINTLVEHKDFGMVQGYFRVRIFADNSAELLIKHLDPRTFQALTNIKFKCHLYDGKAGGIKLFNLG